MAKPLLGEEEKAAVLRVLESGQLAQGSVVKEFEEAFAAFIGVKHAIATGNGTAALHTALMAHDISPGDEVITTPFTFIATANAIKMVGATPVFVDIEEDSFNLNPELVAGAITERTKAVLAVHLFGKAARVDRLREVCRENGLVLLEDACQAHGATHNGANVGSFGTSCFSFYPTKNMTTGEGGMVTTNNDVVAEKARWLIDHGAVEKYTHPMFGYNYRMTNIAAAIGIEQLKKLHEFNAARRGNALRLNEGLAGVPGLVLPVVEEGHVFHQYTVRVNDRDAVAELLKEKGVGSAVYYPIPIHKQGAYAVWNNVSFPAAEKAAAEVLSLPVHPSVTRGEIDRVILAMREVLR